MTLTLCLVCSVVRLFICIYVLMLYLSILIWMYVLMAIIFKYSYMDVCSNDYYIWIFLYGCMFSWLLYLILLYGCMISWLLYLNILIWMYVLWLLYLNILICIYVLMTIIYKYSFMNVLLHDYYIFLKCIYILKLYSNLYLWSAEE